MTALVSHLECNTGWEETQRQLQRGRPPLIPEPIHRYEG